MKKSINLFCLCMFVFIAVASSAFLAHPVLAAEVLLWQDSVSSSGEEIVSFILSSERIYRVEVEGNWWYDVEENLAADVQYYTTDFSDSWMWGNNFPAPDGHSFLQINGEDVSWGSFSNGDTGHMYNIFVQVSQDSALTFRIVDWMDGNYTNNECHIPIRIYGESTVGGTVLDFAAVHLSPLIVATLCFIAILAIIFRRVRTTR